MNIATGAKLILTMLLWSACFPLIAAGIDLAPHLTFAALRAVLAGLALTGLALALRRPLPRKVQDWAVVACIGLGATSLGFLGMFHAVEFVSPGIATVIASSQPLLAAALAGYVLDERLATSGKAGLAIGFVGVVVVALPGWFADGQETYLLGVAYVVLAAFGITLSNVLIKRMAGQVDAILAMGLQMLIGSVPLGLGALAVETPTAVEWSPAFVAVLLALSLLGTALVYWLWISILKTVPLNQANAFSFLIPIFGLTIGALFFHESIGWMQIFGIAFTLLGVGLVVRQGTRTSHQTIVR